MKIKTFIQKKQITLKLFKYIVPLITLGFITEKTYACSSCGSSVSSPLSLELNENLKLYFGLSQNYNFMNYGVQGGSPTKRWVSPLIATKTTSTFSVGFRTTTQSFVTVTGSIVRNEGSDNPSSPFSSGTKVKYLIGDPVISGRYNLINSSIDEEFLPQIQLIGSYKPAIAKNMVDADGDAIDTTGNGFHQTTGGIDFWWGMPFIQFGGSELVTYSFERKPNANLGGGKTSIKRKRELQYTTILTLGHAFKEHNINVQGGVILDRIGKETTTIRDDNTGNVSSVSAKPAQSNSVFALVNLKITPIDMLRFSYTYGGAYRGNLSIFTNSSQTTSKSVVVAYIRTLS